MWLLNKLEKNHFAQIDVPIVFFNFPENVIQTSKLPEKISINVYGRGFSILKYKLTTLSKLFVDLKKYIDSNYTGNKIIFLYTENLLESLNKKFSEEVKILSIEPKTIKFTFSEKLTKKIPIKPRFYYTIQKNYVLTNIIFKPHYVLLSGPAEIIDTIDTIQTKVLKINDIKNITSVECELENIPYSFTNPQKIKITIFAEKSTEKVIKLPTNKIYNETENKLLYFPEYINLKFNVPISKYNLLSADSFNISYTSSLSAENPNKINCIVKLKNKPKNAYNIRFEPAYFTVIKQSK